MWGFWGRRKLWALRRDESRPCLPHAARGAQFRVWGSGSQGGQCYASSERHAEMGFSGCPEYQERRGFRVRV